MPLITVSERLLQPATHHRIPRTQATWIEIQDPDNPDQPPNHYEVGYDFQHQFPNHMPMPGGNGQATFVFACWSNEFAGDTYTTSFVDVVVPDSHPMKVIAYYAPPGGLGPNGGPGWFVDSFSAEKNEFTQDNPFVTVEGNSQATSDANIIGEVSTAGQTLRLDAVASISTGEVFAQWVGNAATTSELEVLAADSNGVAIATYHVPDSVTLPNLDVHAEESVKILWGLIAGGDGVVLTPHGPKHVDPGWGPFAERVLQAGAVARLGQSMESAPEITRLCVNEVHAAVKQLDAGVAKVGDRVVGH